MTEKSQKSFHLGDILSITTGKVLSPRLMDGVLDITEYLYGGKLCCSQAAALSDKCESALLEQLPFLSDIDSSKYTSDDAREWLNEQIAIHGEMHEITPI